MPSIHVYITKTAYNNAKWQDKTKDQPVYRSGVILTPRSHRTKLTGANIHYGHSNVKKTTEATTEDQLKSAIFFPVMTP